jgi:hypothetical protein
VPRLCEFYPGICLITEVKAWKNLSQGKKKPSENSIQNNKKPPQYKLKQTQYKIYPNETVTI